MYLTFRKLRRGLEKRFIARYLMVVSTKVESMSIACIVGGGTACSVRPLWSYSARHHWWGGHIETSCPGGCLRVASLRTVCVVILYIVECAAFGHRVIASHRVARVFSFGHRPSFHLFIGLPARCRPRIRSTRPGRSSPLGRT